MIPSTTRRCSENGLPPFRDATGINGSIRAHSASDKERVRDTRPACPPTSQPVGRHALSAPSHCMLVMQ